MYTYSTCERVINHFSSAAIDVLIAVWTRLKYWPRGLPGGRS